VLGQQWHWSYRFPGADGVLGATSARLMTPDNPFGMDPQDPRGRDDVLIASPELHLPIGRPVRVLLRSRDVLHDFTVPQFRVKMDLVPGMQTFLWFTPTKIGDYEILCEELCGMAHFAMRGRVTIDDERTFKTWLGQYPTFAATLTRSPADPVVGKTLFAPCTACHGPSGLGNRELNAPKLAGQSAWYVKRQLENFKHGVRGGPDQDIYGKQMIPFAGMLADETAIRNVAAYIETLPDQMSAHTVAGDTTRGASLYRTCVACHGASGQGLAATNAPRLAGMSDWYLARQLEHFKNGTRGGHRHDMYGRQMTMITIAVPGKQGIDDVLAYINTLQPTTTRTAMAN
jgi:cytochrome c oxidase subunit 2